MKMPTMDELRAEFHRLKADEAKIVAELAPAVSAFEKKRAELDAKWDKELIPLRQKMIEARDASGLHALQQQIATINRILKGETGAAPAKA